MFPEDGRPVRMQIALPFPINKLKLTPQISSAIRVDVHLSCMVVFVSFWQLRGGYGQVYRRRLLLFVVRCSAYGS